ncbi:MAG: sigma-70 family RNA polymerase sigma factor [Chloroflexi bacterium]|nr:sigma-70 family RNA polymerase sigma factor [Chloroflexota bacterium]
MYRLSPAITGNEADAADVTQDAFVIAWRRLRQLRNAASFDGWLHRIVVNAARMAVRARTRRKVRELEVSPGVASMPSPDVAALTAALETLEPDARAILALHHLEGRSEELATILNVPSGTVKSRLYTARRALRAALESGEGT